MTLLVVLLFAATAQADEKYQAAIDAVSNQCAERVTEGPFTRGSDCTGAKKELFYIKNAEVTQAVFDAQKKIYDLKGDICDKTEKTKKGDLPKGYSVSCIKGKYAEYVISGKKVGFKEFTDSLSALIFSQLNKDMDKEVMDQLLENKKTLRSLKSFASALRSGSNPFYAMSYQIPGSACAGNGDYLVGGNGYKNMVCENGKVSSLDLYLNDKKVTYDFYIKSIYKTLKEANKKAIADLKKKN